MKGNIYFNCRKRAAVFNDKLNSRAGAAECLGVSEGTLARYELGIAKEVPVDIVVMMAELYNAPELQALYCQQECPIGRFFPMATKAEPLEVATIHLLNSLNPAAIEQYSKRLIAIAADGKISDDEHEEFAVILEAFDQAAEAISEMRILFEKHQKEREQK